MKLKLHRKWRSASNFEPGPLPIPSYSREQSHDGPTFSRDDGLLTVHLHNHMVNLVCPEDQRESYDPDEEVGPPSERLRLEWVHGYRGRDGRANLHLLPTGEVDSWITNIAQCVLCQVRCHCIFSGPGIRYSDIFCVPCIR